MLLSATNLSFIAFHMQTRPHNRCPFSPAGAILLGLLNVGAALAVRDVPELDDAGLLIVALLSLIVGVPFALWLPVAKAHVFMFAQRLPRSTYLLSRPLVCLIGTMLASQVIMAGGLTLSEGWRVAAPGYAAVWCAIPYFVSATKRFATPPGMEFAVPMFYPWSRRVVRLLKPDSV